MIDDDMTEDELIGTILQELLLNHAMTKRELARMLKMSIRKLDKVLEDHGLEYLFKEDQKSSLLRLYKRLKLYEDRIDEYLVPIRF